MNTNKTPSVPSAQNQIGRPKRRFAASRAIAALMLREMATRYGRSPGGYVWAIMEPLGAITILTIGFSLIVPAPPLGNSFILFYATGFMPFSLYQSLALHCARSIDFSRALLKYPAVTWVDAIAARFFLNFLTEILVTFILLFGIILLTSTRIILEFPPIVSAVGLAALLGLGIGTLNCAIMGLFPIWAQIWSIATRPLFLMSGIFFMLESMPTAVQNIVWWNPLIHILSLMRVGFYPTYRAEFVNIPYVLCFGLVTLFLGVLLLGRYHRDILNSR